MLGAARDGETIPAVREIRPDRPDTPTPPDELKALEDAIVIMFAALIVELRAEAALGAEAQSRMFERIRRLMDARVDMPPDRDRLASVLERINRSLSQAL